MAWRIDLDVLALLVAVAEEGSLGRGAARTGFQQPNASRAIRELEKATGVVLFVRTPRGSRPTREGGLLVEWARPLLAQASTFTEALDALGERDAGPVEVAASMTIAEHLVPLWLARLRASDPATSVRLRVENSADVVSLVRSGEVEVGFIEDGSSPVGLAQRVVAHDRLLLVVSPDHGWARRQDPVTVDELARTSLVSREVGSGTRAVLEAALGDRVLAPPAVVGNSIAAVRAAVRAGVAPAVLSELAVADLVEDGSLVVVPLAGPDLSRPLSAVWLSGQRPRGRAGRLVAVASERDSGPGRRTR